MTLWFWKIVPWIREETKMGERITRRQLMRAGAVGGLAALLAACQPKVVETVVTKVVKETVIVEGTPEVVEKEVTRVVTRIVDAPTKAPEAKKYTILHWGRSAAPTDPKTELEEGQTRRVAYQEIADEYMELHPDVEIEWYRFPAGSSINEWLLARMTAQDCPDIYWADTEDIWPHINKNWALDITAYLNQPNPYVPGNERWRDQFEDVAIVSQTGPDGKMYGVNMDGAGVMTVYNKNAFAEAGITQEPRTWSEFLSVWQALLDKGYIPFGGDLDGSNCCYQHWTEAHIYNQLVWDKIWDWDDDGNKVIVVKELAQHTQMGDALDWESYLKMMHLVKEWTPFLPTGYEGHIDYRDLFRKGKVAMYLEGNWALRNFKSDPLPFEFAWLPFPIITKDIWPDSPEKVVRIQGAWGAMQYHIPGYLAQTDPDKVPVIIDWLRFSSQPENVTALCAETATVPLTYGATGVPGLAPFSQHYDRAVPYQSWATLSSSAYQAEEALWQAYLPGGMTDAEFLEKAQRVWNAEVDKVLEANPDWKVD